MTISSFIHVQTSKHTYLKPNAIIEKHIECPQIEQTCIKNVNFNLVQLSTS